jgi:hypothetical protein
VDEISAILDPLSTANYFPAVKGRGRLEGETRTCLLKVKIDSRWERFFSGRGYINDPERGIQNH